MENQTRFDLTTAVANWRQELALQPSLTAENRRELETHLLDTVAELQCRGLNDEESFWLARRRVGQPQQVGDEFLKTNPTAIWRERGFWMAFGCLTYFLWTNLVFFILFWTNGGLFVYASPLFIYLPFIVFVIFLAKGQAPKTLYVLATIFNSRWRFAGAAIVFLLIAQGSRTFVRYWEFRAGGGPPHDVFWANQFSQIIWPMMLVLVVAWLFPAQNRKPLKSA